MRVAIELNGPRTSAVASGLGSQVSSWLGPPTRRSRITDRSATDSRDGPAVKAGAPAPSQPRPRPPRRKRSRRPNRERSAVLPLARAVNALPPRHVLSIDTSYRQHSLHDRWRPCAIWGRWQRFSGERVCASLARRVSVRRAAQLIRPRFHACLRVYNHRALDPNDCSGCSEHRRHTKIRQNRSNAGFESSR
jgi:hypothetical protein